MLEKRLSLSQCQVQSVSKTIIGKIQSLSSFISAETVLFYYPIRNEVNILSLIEKSFSGKTACLPRIEKGAGEMTARRVISLNGLTVGKYGIPTPSEDSPLIDPGEIDFVVVPLTAFDENMYRIGYGGGYYDRYLPKCINAVKCGAAYSFQKTDKIFTGNHDIKLNMIVTEV